MAAIEYKIVAGRVDKDGKKISGENFESSRDDTGKYHIIFRPVFGTLYGCSVAQIGFDDGKNDPRDSSSPFAIEEGSMHILTGDPKGNRVDRPFTFVVVGV